MLREFSVPLLGGVAAALLWANFDQGSYLSFIYSPLIVGKSLHFLTNDIFMVFFFAIAAVEIKQSCMPGGDLNPPRKAINPIFATIGGILGPVAVYLALNRYMGSDALTRGWGIPTATDIALAWLVGRLVFGRNHPVISYLLLLAIADDAIGLGIIAVFYPNPNHPIAPLWLLLTASGMGAAIILSKMKVNNYWPYLLLGGVPSWIGLINAQLHPALALVFIVPFFPGDPQERRHLFEEDPCELSTLGKFEHEWKVIVDFGLFLFGLVNAGVKFAEVGIATWLVLSSLIVGKTIGIFLFGLLAVAIGFPLPSGVGKRALLVMGMIAGVGFTVAIFIAGEAFADTSLQGQAKMGAMLSIGAALIAFVTGRALRLRRHC